MRKSLVFLGSLVLGLCGVAHADLKDGLIAYYPFNGNANDESGNGNDGVVRGATLIEDRSEIPNSAFNFDGQNDFIDCPALPNSQDISVSFWFKTDKSKTGRQFVLFEGDSAGGADYAIDIVNSSIRLITKDNSEWGISMNLIRPSEWHHLVAIYDVSNGVRSIWLDGESIIQLSLNGGNGNVGNHGPFTIGALNDGRSTIGFFKGAIDDIRIYDRGLSEDEVGELFTSAARFQIIEGTFTWSQAKANAEAIGGRLAVLDTQEKINAANAYLEELGEWPNLWIGLSDQDQEGQWKWITDDVLSANNWWDGEPNGGTNENHVELVRSDNQAKLRWNDVPEATAQSYLLEILVAPPAPPVVELETFYESNPDETITIDATPTSGFPDEFYYSWTFNGFEIPSFLGGNQPTMNLIGDVAQDGTWSVIVSNSVGSTEVSFEYRMFVDNDSDGLSNYREENFTLTNPNLADSDDDGLSDPDEISVYNTDPNIADIDEDGLNDSEEVAATTDPSVADTDNDGILDGAEVKTYASNPKKADTDNDGIADAAEIAAGLDINTAESIADAVAFLTQELANRPPIDGFEEAIAAARASGQEDVTSNPSEYNLYDAASYDAVVQERDARPTAAEYALVLEDRDSRPSLQAYNAVVADRDSRPTKEAYDAVVAQRDARPTKEAYDTAIAERDARPTLEEVKDGRLGSVLLVPDTAENKVKIRFSIEESDELGAWTSRTEEAEVDIPLAAGKRFFRFSVKEDE